MSGLHILNVMLSSGLGGVEFAFLRYAQVLQSLGHQVTGCVTSSAAITKYLPLQSPRANLIGSFEYSPTALWSAALLLRRAKPDVILTHGRRAFTTFAMARGWTTKDAALVNVLHRKIFTRLKAADRIICVSAEIKAAAAGQNVASEKLVHIPNFIADQRPTSPRRPVGSSPTIGFLGRMVPEKGLDLLINALKVVKDAGFSFNVQIGGDGPLRSALQALAAANGLEQDIVWKGWVEDTSAFYDGIDILVVPSRYESFGLVTLEAFNSFKAVLATRTSGSMEIIDHGHNGLLCNIDVESIAGGIIALIADPGRALALADCAHQDAQKYMTPLIGPRLDACLSEAISVRRSTTAGAAAGY